MRLRGCLLRVWRVADAECDAGHGDVERRGGRSVHGGRGAQRPAFGKGDGNAHGDPRADCAGHPAHERPRHARDPHSTLRGILRQPRHWQRPRFGLVVLGSATTTIRLLTPTDSHVQRCRSLLPAEPSCRDRRCLAVTVPLARSTVGGRGQHRDARSRAPGSARTGHGPTAPVVQGVGVSHEAPCHGASVRKQFSFHLLARWTLNEMKA
eukprot:3936274-Rhodomonas_salina.1